MTTTLLTGGTVFAPDELGTADILSVSGGIASISAPGALAPDAVSDILGDVSIIDCTGSLVMPGLVDSHLHILGGGGGQGFDTRIPELPADAILEAGITTCVGMPGVDTISKPPTALLARAAALNQQGVRAVAMAGGFHWPAPTVTGDLFRDLYALPQLVGVKVALGERIATAPGVAELARLLSELEWLAGATGRAALLHAHLGTRNSAAVLIREALHHSGAAPERVHLTHANYTRDTLAAAIELGGLGCLIDVNPLLNPDRVAGSVDPVDAVRQLLDAGIPVERLTLSTDGNASVPRVTPSGTRETFSYQLGLLGTVRDLVASGVVGVASAISLVTRNPARALRLNPVGTLAVDAPADLLVTDSGFSVRHVISGGELVVRDGRAVSPSQFRDPRWS